MISLLRTNSDHLDFKKLVEALDADLQIRDGDEHAFYATLNKTDQIKHVVVGYQNDIPVACGAIRKYEDGVMEIKRMFVVPAYRGNGFGSVILKELENWCIELQYKKCILETGKKQPEAIALYQKNGYDMIPNFGKYATVENSVCFEKILK